MTRLQQKLSAAVVEKAEIFFGHLRCGGGVKEAFNKTMGDGAYEKLVSELYDEIRTRHTQHKY